MNVAIITDSFPPMMDGVSRCASGYAHALHGHEGCSCVVITPRVPNVKYDYPFPVYTFRSVRSPYAEYRAGHPLTPRLAAKLKDMGIEILHVHSPFVSMTIARQLRRFLKIPIVFTQHTKWDSDISCAVSSNALQKSLKWYVYNNIKAADEVWVVSRGAGEYLLNRGYKGEFIVMPNGTDFPGGDADASLLRQIDAAYDLPGGVPVLLFVGRMMWYKNIKLILDALGLLLDRSFDFRMLFVGDGDDLGEVKRTTETMGLSEKVFFAGRVGDRELLRAYYARSDLLVFPSVYDNAPLVVREAAPCSCPSLVVRDSSAAEILEDKETGFFADETAESVAGAIQNSLSDGALFDKVSKTARERIYLPWDKAIEKSIKRYEEIIRYSSDPLSGAGIM